MKYLSVKGYLIPNLLSVLKKLYIDGKTMDTVTDFIVLCSKITAEGDCSHEIKRHLLLGKKSQDNLDSVLKSRDITLQRPG